MKKNIILATLILATVFMSACRAEYEYVGSGSEAPAGSSEIATEESNTEIQEVINEGESESGTEESTEELFTGKLTPTDFEHVGILFSDNGTYTDSLGNGYEYDYTLPQFWTDSPNAASINTRISDTIQPIIDSEYAAMEEGSSLIVNNVTYAVYEYENMTSIVIMKQYPDGSLGYHAYTYDFAKDKEVTNAEILEITGFTEETYLNDAYRWEEGLFKSTYGDVFMEGTDLTMYLQPARDVTTMDLPMYISKEGNLNVCLPIPSPAGASYYYNFVSLGHKK